MIIIYCYSSAVIDRSNLVTIYPTQGVAELKMQALTVPLEVDANILRNMTNLEESVQLDWQTWANYSGYQYSYMENAKYYKQWWVTHNHTILFVTYSSDTNPGIKEAESIEMMVNSIKLF